MLKSLTQQRFPSFFVLKSAEVGSVTPGFVKRKKMHRLTLIFGGSVEIGKQRNYKYLTV